MMVCSETPRDETLRVPPLRRDHQRRRGVGDRCEHKPDSCVVRGETFYFCSRATKVDVAELFNVRVSAAGLEFPWHVATNTEHRP